MTAAVATKLPDLSSLMVVDHERFVIDLIYMTSNHMFGRPLYKELGLTQCYAHSDLHEKLMKLTPRLKELDLKLVIFDCFRPVSVTAAIWNMLPDERYAANPANGGSNHNRAAAVDCYLARGDGTKLEFPTTPAAYLPGLEKDLPAWLNYFEKAHHAYACTPEERVRCENRDLLKTLMEEVGLLPLPEEWWHYELPGAQDYPIL